MLENTTIKLNEENKVYYIEIPAKDIKQKELK